MGVLQTTEESTTALLPDDPTKDQRNTKTTEGQHLPVSGQKPAHGQNVQPLPVQGKRRTPLPFALQQPSTPFPMALRRSRRDHRPELSTKDRPAPIPLPSRWPQTCTQISTPPRILLTTQTAPSSCRPRVRDSNERSQGASPIHLFPITLHPRPIAGQTVLQPQAPGPKTPTPSTSTRTSRRRKLDEKKPTSPLRPNPGSQGQGHRRSPPPPP